MSQRRIEMEDLKRIIHGFRVSDLQTLLSAFGRNHIGRKTELQSRAMEMLLTPPLDINVEKYKQKIRELFREEQQMQIQNANANNRTMQMQRNPANTYSIPSNQYAQSVQARNQIRPNSSVYQNGYSYSTMYIPNPAIIESNTTNSVRILTQAMRPTNVIFRKLPFYTVKQEVLKPVLLISNCPTSLRVNGRINNTQEFTLAFVLNCTVASDIAMNRDVPNKKYISQIQLRICAVDSTAPMIGNTEYDDLLPLGLVVRVNGVQCTSLPPLSPSSRPGQDTRRIPGPIDISSLLKLSPMNSNSLVINWIPEITKTFAITLNLVEKLSSDLLLSRLKEKLCIPVDVTKQAIRKQYGRVLDDDDCDADMNAEDDDVATTIVRVSLMCPLARFRMNYPAKGKNCGHLQCFDGSAFICLNEKKSMWVCPVCHKRLNFDDLLIDQYFVDVLRNEELSDDCQEVQLFVDGTWKSYFEESTSESNNEKQNSSTAANSPFTSPVYETEPSAPDSIKIMVGESGNAESANIVDSVVDLTCEDEEVDPPVTSPVAVPNPPAEEEPMEVNSAPVSPETSQMNEDTEGNAVVESTVTDENAKLEVPVDADMGLTTEPAQEENAVTPEESNTVPTSQNVISLDSPTPPQSPSGLTTSTIIADDLEAKEMES